MEKRIGKYLIFTGNIFFLLFRLHIPIRYTKLRRTIRGSLRNMQGTRGTDISKLFKLPTLGITILSDIIVCSRT